MANINNIFAHRGLWRAPIHENTGEAIIHAFLSGFDVEVDIRADKNGKLVTGHDKAQPFDWHLIMSCPQRKTIAFHVKEKGLCNKLHELVEDYKYLDYLVFGVDSEEMDLYMSMFGKDKVAFEYNAGDSFEEAFNCRNEIIWVAELDGKQLSKKELVVLKSQNKKLYVVTQDCHAGDMILFGVRIMQLHEGLIDGICTDNPEIINKYTT